MKKLLNKKGFTLMEMLIVVAIIVILVAISIPAFSSSLDSAREASDEANLRSAKAAAVLAISLGTAPADGDYYDELGFCHGLYQSFDEGINWEFVKNITKER